MWKEKKTRTIKLEKPEADTCPMIVRKSVPRMRTVKSKEKIKVTTSNRKCPMATCETSGNIMRLCVNLMPVLAAAKEPVEAEEEKDENNSCTSKKKPETCSENDPPVTKSIEQTLKFTDSFTGLTLDTKQPLSSQFVLPPITKPKPASIPEYHKTQRSHTPLPAISSSEQTSTISSNFTGKSCKGNGTVKGEEPDSRPWVDNPLFSNSRSAEFRVPDISLSSLDTLLQTVTQKLGRKRRGGDEGPWRRVQSDHLLTAVSEQRLRERSVGQQINGSCTDRNLGDIDAVRETSVGGHIVSRKTSLPPLSSAQQPVLVLSMTKKNLHTSSTLQ